MNRERGARLASGAEDMARTATERSDLYGFLAVVFREEANAALLRRINEPDFLAALSGAGVRLAEDFLRRPEEELIEELAVEYTHLFIGPGKHVSPHTSVYLGGEGGGLWGSSTAEVKSFIESAGFEYEPSSRGIPDHISVEFEFMAKLTQEEARAWKEGDGEGLSRCLDIEQAFLCDHLSRWVPSFCAKVVDMAGMSFYRELAKLTADFIDSEQAGIAARREQAGASGEA